MSERLMQWFLARHATPRRRDDKRAAEILAWAAAAREAIENLRRAKNEP